MKTQWFEVWHSLPPYEEVVIGRWLGSNRGCPMKRCLGDGTWAKWMGDFWDDCPAPVKWRTR